MWQRIECKRWKARWHHRPSFNSGWVYRLTHLSCQFLLFLSSFQILPCHVCWSCWQDHVSLPLISMANDVNQCLSFWDSIEIFVENHYCLSLACICQQLWRESRFEVCPSLHVMEWRFFKAKMAVTFQKWFKYWKLNNGKFKITVSERDFKSLIQIVCYGTSIQNILFIKRNVTHVLYSLCYDDWVYLFVSIINSYFSGACNSSLKHYLDYEILIPGAFLLQIGRKIQFSSVGANVLWFLRDAKLHLCNESFGSLLISPNHRLVAWCAGEVGETPYQKVLMEISRV